MWTPQLADLLPAFQSPPSLFRLKIACGIPHLPTAWQSNQIYLRTLKEIHIQDQRQ